MKMPWARGSDGLTQPAACRSVLGLRESKLMEVHGTVRDILKLKKPAIWTTNPRETVFDAIRIMGEQGIGSIIVVDNNEVVGVLTERDYSRKVVLKGRTSRDTKVGDIISPASTVKREDTIETCMQLMTSQRIRHLPVLDDDRRLLGVVSMGDLVNWVMNSQRQTIQQLHGYISGEYPG